MLTKLLFTFDRYAVFTGLGVITLQYSLYFPFSYLESTHDMVLSKITILSFFSILVVYALDHMLDQKKTISLPMHQHVHQSLPVTSQFPKSLKNWVGWVIIFTGVIINTGIIVTDYRYIGVGVPVIILCGLHFLVFHTKAKKIFFPVKEMSVALVVTFTVVYPLYALGIQTNEHYLTFTGVTTFLLMLNSTWFYSLTRINEDIKNDSPSLFVKIGYSNAKIILLLIAILIAIMIAVATQYLSQQIYQSQENNNLFYFQLVAILQVIVVCLTFIKNQSTLYLTKLRIISELIFLKAWLLNVELILMSMLSSVYFF